MTSPSSKPLSRKRKKSRIKDVFFYPSNITLAFLAAYLGGKLISFNTFENSSNSLIIAILVGLFIGTFSTIAIRLILKSRRRYDFFHMALGSLATAVVSCTVSFILYALSFASN